MVPDKHSGEINQEEIEILSKDIARQRLKTVLQIDRVNITPEIMELMRRDLTQVLLSYMDLDKDTVNLEVERVGKAQSETGIMVTLSAAIKKVKKQGKSVVT